MQPRTVADYRTEVFNAIFAEEDYRSLAYYDTASPPRATIGYGFNFERETGYLRLVLNELGIFSGRTNAEINTIIEVFYTAIEGAQDGNRADLRNRLNAAAQNYGVTTFQVNEVQSNNIFYAILEGSTIGGVTDIGKEARLNNRLRDSQGNIALARNTKRKRMGRYAERNVTSGPYSCRKWPRHCFC